MDFSADRRRLLLWKTLGTLMEQLPVQLAVRVAQAVGWLVALRPSATRQRAEENLRTILEYGADHPIDDKVLRRWVRRYYASYARYWAEGATLPGLAPEQAVDRIAFVEGEEHLLKAMAAGKGTIIALPHIGSWEWGGALMAQMGFPMTAVAEVLEPPELFEYFVAKREQVGLRIVPLDGNAGKQLLKVLRDGGLVGLLCDRDLTGDGIDVELLGRRARMPAGPATLALRTGATLIPGVAYSGPGKYHHIVLDAPLDTTRTKSLRADVATTTQDLADALSRLIARSPEQWHVFVDPFDVPTSAAAQEP
jgi:phosphatidylinositol dimannoside acyltransferase